VMAPGKPATFFWLLDIGPSFSRAIGLGEAKLCGTDLRPVPGLGCRRASFPRLTPWAKIFRPSG
jgi:hypothetical protein